MLISGNFLIHMNTRGNHKNTNYICFFTAPPLSPFPVIQECSNNPEILGQPCSLLKNSMNITCSVFDYFPSISLSFLHKSETVASLKSVEWNNTDRTRSKSVTIEAHANDDPYICVASDIPGLQDVNQTSTIYLNALPEYSTESMTFVTSTESVSHPQNHLSK